jgi:hypothetical protein
VELVSEDKPPRNRLRAAANADGRSPARGRGFAARLPGAGVDGFRPPASRGHFASDAAMLHQTRVSPATVKLVLEVA